MSGRIGFVSGAGMVARAAVVACLDDRSEFFVQQADSHLEIVKQVL
jgi:hypothetical protein